MRQLRVGQILQFGRRDVRGDLPVVSCQFQLAQLEFESHCLHMQRRVGGPERRNVHSLWSMQQGIHGAKRRPVRTLQRRNLQIGHWHFSVQSVSGGDKIECRCR